MAKATLVKPLRFFAFAGLFLLLLMSSAAQEANRIILEIIPLDESSRRVCVEAEIAASVDERAEGLMWRKEVPDGSGMIFVYPRDERMSFWMKNTLVPLSIAFIDSRGVLREILDMKPQDLTPVKSGGYRRYALEVPQGWFAKNGIAAGSSLSPKTLIELKAIPAHD